jgi:hypothetical protein
MTPEPTSQLQNEGEVNSLLQSSVKRYEDILSLFTAISSETGDSNLETLHAGGMELVQLQEQAALADQLLISMMQEMAPDRLNHSLLAKRQDVIHKILTHNRSLLSTAKNIKSLLAHDLKEIQGGRTALSGYQRQTNPVLNGGILNDSR